MTGRTLLHYEILDKIGEGGMGVVYKARDTHLDRLVAIKFLPPDKITDPERRARFVREAKAASALHHPNIVTIHDVASDSGHDFIVMEYVAGKTLGQLIGRKGLKLNDAIRYGIQIADALARAHAAGIVHRDIKPSNILVDELGAVRIVDFGLAKLTESAPAREGATLALSAKTEDGRIIGTASYMSPEQAEGKPVDARSDVFSFGAVLYEMLSGQRAFRGGVTSLDAGGNPAQRSFAPRRRRTSGNGAHRHPLPPQGSGAALAQHGRREGRSRRAEGRVRFR